MRADHLPFLRVGATVTAKATFFDEDVDNRWSEAVYGAAWATSVVPGVVRRQRQGMVLVRFEDGDNVYMHPDNLELTGDALRRAEESIGRRQIHGGPSSGAVHAINEEASDKADDGSSDLDTPLATLKKLRTRHPPNTRDGSSNSSGEPTEGSRESNPSVGKPRRGRGSNKSRGRARGGLGRDRPSISRQDSDTIPTSSDPEQDGAERPESIHVAEGQCESNTTTSAGMASSPPSGAEGRGVKLRASPSPHQEQLGNTTKQRTGLKLKVNLDAEVDNTAQERHSSTFARATGDPAEAHECKAGSQEWTTVSLAQHYKIGAAIVAVLVVFLAIFWACRSSPASSGALLSSGCNMKTSAAAWEREVLPGGGLWSEWAEHLEYAVAHPPNRVRKAVTILLAGGSEQAYAETVVAMPRLFPACHAVNCLLHLQGADFSDRPDSPGELQSALVSFLRNCPQGVVVFSGLQHLDRRALPVLFSALSEHGQFTDMGKQVHSSGAVYVFVAAIESILSQGEPHELERNIKQEIARVLLQNFGCGSTQLSRAETGDSDCDELVKSLKALSRRFDIVGAVG